MGYTVTGLRGTDVAIGNLLCRSLVGLDPAVEGDDAKSLQEFLSRTPNQQVFVGEFDSPAEFLRALRGARKQQEGTEELSQNVANLPVIYFYRVPGMQTADPSKHPAEYGLEQQHEEGKKVIYDSQVVTLEYQVIVLAWTKSMTDLLAGNLKLWIGDKANRAFEAKEVANGLSWRASGLIDNYRALDFVNLSTPKDERRLYGVGASLIVTTEVIRSRVEDHVNMRYILEKPWVMNCGR